MSWNDKKYDDWKLASPYENEGPEVFNTEDGKLFSCNEDDINDYMDKEIAAKKDSSVYSLLADDLEEYLDTLADELGLSQDAYGAIELFNDNYISEKEYAKECKYQQMKDDKLTR